MLKIAPVSGDLLVKIALGAAAVGALWYLVRSAGSQAGTALDAAQEWAKNVAEAGLQAVNPVNPNNLASRAATAVTTAAVGYPDTAGGAAYSLSHLDPANPNAAVDLWNSISAGDTAY